MRKSMQLKDKWENDKKYDNLHWIHMDHTLQMVINHENDMSLGGEHKNMLLSFGCYML